LELGDPEGHLVRPLDDLEDGGRQSSPKISDHCSGESFSFNASLSSLSCVREPFEDVPDIVHPSVVRVT
jgi:hypothetical protein